MGINDNVLRNMNMKISPMIYDPAFKCTQLCSYNGGRYKEEYEPLGKREKDRTST